MHKEQGDCIAIPDVETAGPDPKVVIEGLDPSLLAATNGMSEFVSASEVETARTQAQAVQRHGEAAVEQLRVYYPTQALKFDYTFHKHNHFEVSTIYHDDKFTYIESSARNSLN